MNYSKSILDPVFLAHGTPSSFDLVRLGGGQSPRLCVVGVEYLHIQQLCLMSLADVAVVINVHLR